MDNGSRAHQVVTSSLCSLNVPNRGLRAGQPIGNISVHIYEVPREYILRFRHTSRPS